MGLRERTGEKRHLLMAERIKGSTV